MNKTFLYKLFNHSKAGFLLIVIYIAGYTVFFYKKMDAVLFPYNSMFTIDFTKNYTASAYQVKINNVPVSITRNLYWKKDFLEASLRNYAKYKNNNDAVFMDHYLNQSVPGITKREFLLKRLCPDKNAAVQWLQWYVSFAGYTIPANSTIELLKYDFIFRNNEAVIQDSITIYKTSTL
jgi:hypothetical protein